MGYTVILPLFSKCLTLIFRIQEYEMKKCVDDLCPYVDVKEEPLLCQLWHEANHLKNTTSPPPTIDPGINVFYREALLKQCSAI